MREFGVHSEVGKLRAVMVCRPSLAHQRLTPGNCHELLFDDVIWVHEAQKDHYDFVLKMQERGIEVLELHDLLAESLKGADARKFVLDRTITEHAVGTAAAAEMRPWLEEMPAEQLAIYLIGGIAISDLPGTSFKAMRRSTPGCGLAIHGSLVVSTTTRCVKSAFRYSFDMKAAPTKTPKINFMK